MSHSHEDPACDVAHGHAQPPPADKVLVAVFATPVARFLLRYGSDAGYRAVLIEPDPERAKEAGAAGPDRIEIAQALDGSRRGRRRGRHRPPPA